jgi:hypothetical protein
MLKRIPKSDISIRPFKAYKEWSFSGSAALAEPRITLLEAELGQYDSSATNTITTGNLSGSSFNKHSVYGQLRAQFYNGNEHNPFLRTGNKSNVYSVNPLTTERFLSGSAKVISIPKIYVGEGIKKGSVVLIDDENLPTEFSYTDDSYGNLQDYRDRIYISKIDVQNDVFNFTDLSEYVYSASLEPFSLGAFDIQLGTLDLIYNGKSQPTIQLISLDINSGIAIAEDIPFLPKESQGIKIGNVFYNQGLIVLTRESATKLQNQWKLDYKSTQTIYEHEYLLVVNEDEFNVSQNPTAVVEVGKETQRYITSDGKTMNVVTNTGTKYIKKKSILEDGSILDYRIPSSFKANISGGFEHYELSGSVDSTGSFLAPFITTIGLYDDNCDLVAVAKLPQPIKSEPEIPVNFIIRFDT